MEFTGLGHHNHHHQHHNNSDSSHKNQKDYNADNSHSDSGTSFADMKRRIGNHRRSLKDKMKKFYVRGDRVKINKKDAEKDAFLTNKVKTSSSSSSQQNSRPKKEKNIFGSLPRMRKSRTSASLDEKIGMTKEFEKSRENPEIQIIQSQDDFDTAVRNSLMNGKTTDL